MKTHLYTAILVLFASALISWGVDGHKAVAKIAENHLTPKTREAVHNLLGFETMADVSSFADEIRSDPKFKVTGAWHFVDLPAGYSYQQFADTVKNMPATNAYKALISSIRDLQNPKLSKATKTTTLKFLIHFVGDMHQPMHVSAESDRGGNKIAVSLNGNNTNLHALWDETLIDHEGLGYKKMATAYDTATPEEIKKWQSDDIMLWLWESYQISTILYQEAAENPQFDEAYYQSHLPLLQKRIEKAGIRLAGILNNIYDPGAPAQ